MIKQIEAYRTSDGRLFDDEDKARDHQTDIIGQLLDNLLPHDDRGNVTQSDRYNILTKQLSDPALRIKIAALHQALSFGE
jgi:hypothetical protein